MNIVWVKCAQDAFLLKVESGYFFERFEDKKCSLDTYTSIDEAETAYTNGEVEWIITK